MKQITAIIQPHLLNKVKHALHLLPHFPGYTLLRASGHARGRAEGHAYHADESDLHEHRDTLLLIFCSDEHAPQIVEAVRQNAYTGLSGDGLIAVSEVAELVRIRTNERGDDAV